MKTALALLAALPLLAADPTFRVRIRDRRGESVVELPRERYVAAVLAGESSVFRSDEALKAMAVAARTYGVRFRGRHSAEGFDFCATTHCQRVNLDAITPRLQAIADATAGELLWYEGTPAFTPYSRNCGGRTEDAAAVWPDLAAPYLKAHDDPYCARAESSAWQWSADGRRIAEALVREQIRVPRLLEQIAIAQRTPSGRAFVLQLSGGGESIPVSASSFRFAIGREIGWNTIRSDRYQVHSAGGTIVFQGSGSGHGVGLCQDGAEQMGIAGRSYHEILAFYFPGTSAGVTARGIAWQKLGGDSITLLTTNPGSDGAVLALAERQLRAAAQRAHSIAPRNIEILVYPYLDAFRDATGEPGWVAAHTVGRRIHLQPVAILQSRGALESTLRHELLHVIVESQAAPGLPLWFREGLVEYLDHPVGFPSMVLFPSDAQMRQIADQDEARRAYAAAAGAVKELATHYGETAMFDWLRRGLSPEVKNASSSHPATKNK